MAYKHKPGYLKRKEHAEREEREAIAMKKQPTLQSFLKLNVPRPSNDSDLNLTERMGPNQETSNSSEHRSSSEQLGSAKSHEISKTSENQTPDSNKNYAESDSFFDSDRDDSHILLNLHQKQNEEVSSSTPRYTLLKNSDAHEKVRDRSDEDKNTLCDFDIGTVTMEFLDPATAAQIISRGHQKMPNEFPRDIDGKPFYVSLLKRLLPNGETVERDWLVWSHEKSAFFCLPCRLFSVHTVNRSLLCCPSGFSKNQKYKKLYDRLKSHETAPDHLHCYFKWRQSESRARNNSTINHLLNEQLTVEISKWRDILTRILVVILFLGERGLALRGDSHLIGDRSNGNFLGILELISHYDSVLHKHLEEVRGSQENHKRLQVHYLSADIQNAFIEICAKHVQSQILEERRRTKNR